MRSLALALFATVSLLAADPPKADDKKAKLITEVEAKVKEVDESKASNAEKAKEYAAAGQAFLQLRQPGRAVEVFTKSIAADDNPAVKDRRGDAYLWAGQFAEAVADYDAFLKTNPRFAPEHWRRGIALYYAGKHADGVAQFEVHKTANPQDVENAAWHYLCNVKVVGKDKARKELIDVTRDRRVPMAEIQKLFAGTLKPEDVLAAGEKAQGVEKVSGRFYAHLYVGLWYEAEGDAAKAKEHLTTAVEKYEVPDYMWDVGNAHLKMLKAKK